MGLGPREHSSRGTKALRVLRGVPGRGALTAPLEGRSQGQEEGEAPEGGAAPAPSPEPAVHRVRLWSDLRSPGWPVPGLSLQCSGRPSRPCSSSTGTIRSRSGTWLGWGRENKAGGVLPELRSQAAGKLCSLAARVNSACLSPVSDRPPPLPDALSPGPWSASSP